MNEGLKSEDGDDCGAANQKLAQTLGNISSVPVSRHPDLRSQIKTTFRNNTVAIGGLACLTAAAAA